MHRYVQADDPKCNTQIKKKPARQQHQLKHRCCHVHRCQRKQILSSIWHLRRILTCWHEWQCTHVIQRYNIWNDHEIGLI